MSDPSKAVFLSYASQDAEAARQICDALRAAGVEVWFDTDGGLEHGDEWDAKIRRQIKECVLFIPIISANTQARHEGYFRIEWELAAQRAMGIASGVPFILPVVIDDTREPGALVPDRFRMVQWTRLPRGVVPVEVTQRFLKLWEQRTGPQTTDPSASLRAGHGPQTDEGLQMRPSAEVGRPLRGRLAWAIGGGIALALIVVAILLPWRDRPGSAAPTPAAPTEVQVLVTKARQILDEGDEANRETYALAEDLLKRAVALDPANALAWTTYADLSYFLVWHAIDMSDSRKAAMQQQAERARTLAPDLPEAIIVSADIGAYLRIDLPTLERQMLDLTRRLPGNWRAYRTLGSIYRFMGRTDDSLRALQRAYELSHESPRASADLVNVLIRRNRWLECEPVVAEALKQRAVGRILWYDVVLRVYWRGDVSGAAASLASWPGWLLLSDRGAFQAWQTWFLGRQPDKALAVIQAVPRDYLSDYTSTGPRAAFTARAHEMAGHAEAARADWETAIQVCDRVLATSPETGPALYWKAWALARLGRLPAAEALCTQMQQRGLLSAVGASHWGGVNIIPALWVTVGRPEQALTELAQPRAAEDERLAVTRAMLELDPAYYPLRGDPRFQKILEQAPAPPADMASPSVALSAAGSAKADVKSVVVLPFANLSGDPEQEYFSDGLTEEILNALARERDLRVPGRASAFSFKGKGASAAEIAEALNVAQLVEGSVRKSGNKVRISVQLTRASDGFSEALPTVERELTDIFALQDEVARLVVEKLTQRTKTTAPVAVLTKVPEAYDAYLKGRALEPDRRTPALYRQREALFQRAVELDPNFAEAWGELARVHALYYSAGYDSSAERVAQADRALAQAQRLAPESIKVLRMAGDVAWLAHRNAAAARAHFESLLRRQPNDPEVRFALASIRRPGEEAAAVSDLRQATELDPGNYLFAAELASRLSRSRRWDEAMAEQRRALALRPGDLQAGFTLAELPFKASGAIGPGEAFFAGLSPTQLNSPLGLFLRKRWAFARGDFATYIRLDRVLPYLPDFITEQNNPEQAAYAMVSAAVLMAAGDTAGGRTRLGDILPQLRVQVEKEPGNVQAWTGIGGIAALLNQSEEALRAARRAVELNPESSTWKMNQVIVEAWAGDKNKAVDMLGEVLRLSSGTIWTSGAASVHELRLNAFFAPLKDNPRFQALLNDPKNNEPLF